MVQAWLGFLANNVVAVTRGGTGSASSELQLAKLLARFDYSMWGTQDAISPHIRLFPILTVLDMAVDVFLGKEAQLEQSFSHSLASD